VHRSRRGRRTAWKCLDFSVVLTLNLGWGSNAFGAALLLLGAFTASQTVQGSILAPAMLPNTANLFDQTVATKVGFPSRELKLDEESHRIIEELRTLATDAGFRPGDDIIAVTYMPGLVFALGGRSPGHPTFLVWTEKYLRYSKLALQFSEVARRKEAFLLVSKDAAGGWLKDLLKSGGLDFPAGYQRIGTVTGWGNEFTLYRPVD
jgi:hypothetical protein